MLLLIGEEFQLMHWKRVVIFILINILVSALTTSLVLFFWDRAHREDVPKIDAEKPGLTLPSLEQPAPTSKPEQPLQAYQVKAGETLGEIALAYNISVEELLSLNGLTDPNSIGAGTTIFVPLDTEHSENLDAQNVGPSTTSNTGQVEIVGVFGAGDLTSERVQIRGLGQGTLSLTGWRLWDEDGNEYIFPQITLFANGAVDIYSDVGVDTVVSLFWRSGQPIWSPGEMATLIDEGGNIQSTFMIP